MRNPRDRKGSGEVLLVAGLTLFLLSIFLFFFLKIYFRNAGIVPGVFFLGHDLGYLRQDKALTRIEQIVRSTYDAPVYVRQGDKLWILRYGEHFKIDFDAGAVLLDAMSAGRKRTVFQRVHDFVYLSYPRVDLEWTPSIDRKFSVPNISRALKKLSSARIYARRTTDPAVIELTILSGEMAVRQVVEALERSIRKEPISPYREIELSHLEKAGLTKLVPVDDPDEGFSKTIAANATVYDKDDRQRENNILLAVSRIDGTILNPGDRFSFNELVGPRTEEEGFEKVAIVHHDSVEQDLEAGVRQVATTLYKPMLAAGLKVLERHISDYYTEDIDYCQPGLEATVSTSSSDLVFENTLSFPVMLRGTAGKGRIEFELLGVRKPAGRIEIRLSRLQKISHDTRVIKDPRLPKGVEIIDQAGIDGVAVKVFRTYYNSDGIKYRDELLYDKPDEYLARTAIVRVGTGSSDKSPYASPATTDGGEGASSTEQGFLEPGLLAPSLDSDGN